MPAAGCCGRSGRATGAAARSRRRKPSQRSRPPSRPASRSPSARRAGNSCTRAHAPATRSASSRCRATMPGCATSVRRSWSTSAGARARRRLACSTPGAVWSTVCISLGPGRPGRAQGAGDRGRDRYRAPFVLEGGAIHVDGEGTLLDHRGVSAEPESQSAAGRGSWRSCCTNISASAASSGSGKGVVDDETDGHVDNLCCFARPGKWCLTWTDDKRDPQYRVSQDAYERLMGHAMRGAGG